MRTLLCFATLLGLALTAAPARATTMLSLHAPTLQLSHAAPRLLDVSLHSFTASEVPLDTGGGGRAGESADTRHVLCFILGFFPGFGIGHLLAHNRDGFILFLVVDVAILCVAIVLSALVAVVVGRRS